MNIDKTKLDKILDDYAYQASVTGIDNTQHQDTKEEIKKLILELSDTAYLQNDPDISNVMFEFDKLVKQL